TTNAVLVDRVHNQLLIGLSAVDRVLVGTLSLDDLLWVQVDVQEREDRFLNVDRPFGLFNGGFEALDLTVEPEESDWFGKLVFVLLLLLVVDDNATKQVLGNDTVVLANSDVGHLHGNLGS